MKKRIAVFTGQFPGKVSTFFSRDVFMLIKAGFEVDIFTIYPIREKNWKWVPIKYQSTIKNSTKVLYLNPINLYRNDSSISSDVKIILHDSIRFGFRQYLKSLLVIRQSALWKRLFDGKYDYMLSYWGNYAGTYAYLSNKALTHKIPFSFFLHAGTDLYRDQIYLEEKIKYATNIITVCEFNKIFLNGLYPVSFNSFSNKLILYNLGVDLNEINFNAKKRAPFTLLTIGNLDSKKGFVSVIKALSILEKDFNDVKLIMIGEGPEKKNIEELAKQIGVAERVIIKGHLPFETVKEYLSNCTVLIHPSSDLGDAVPTVIKEALASGLPVIGSNIAGIPELLDHGNTGILFSPGDIHQLASSIQMLLESQELREQYSHKGRKFAEEKFDMYKNCNILIQQLKLNQ